MEESQLEITIFFEWNIDLPFLPADRYFYKDKVSCHLFCHGKLNLVVVTSE